MQALVSNIGILAVSALYRAKVEWKPILTVFSTEGPFENIGLIQMLQCTEKDNNTLVRLR